MQTPLVSIVIPIYNVEHYLRQCLESVTNQTYRNLEIILVDDGSPDDCPQICDNVAAKDDRIIVIHKKNGGLSDARNAGLEKASGDYIFFVDSDDFVTKDCVEKLVLESQKKNYDVVIAQHAPVPAAKKETGDVKEFCSNLQIVRAFSENEFLPCAWNKLYKTSFVKKNNLTFYKGILFEDQLWSLRWTTQAAKICVIPCVTYIYNTRNSSIMDSCKTNLIQSLASWEIIITEYNRLLSMSNLSKQLKSCLLIQKIEESLNFTRHNFSQFKDFYERIQIIVPIQTLYGHYKTNSVIKNTLYGLFNFFPSSLFQFLLYIHIKIK